MNITGLFLSYLLLFLMFLIAIVLPRFKIKDNITRKIVHIGISNWWIIAMIFFDDYSIALIPPVSFLILNYLSYRFNIVKSIERNDKKELGTIYYPLTLIILVLFTFGYLKKPYIGAIGVLIMGYGDGGATIFGQIFGKTKIYKKKTYIGSLAMFIISSITIFILLSIYNPSHILLFSYTIALVATILELFSYKGIDNLTVPLFSSFLYYILQLII